MLSVSDLLPLVGLLVGAVSQNQSLWAQWDQFELVLDLPVALWLVDELTAAQTQLQLREQVLSTLIALTHTHTHTLEHSHILISVYLSAALEWKLPAARRSGWWTAVWSTVRATSSSTGNHRGGTRGRALGRAGRRSIGCSELCPSQAHHHHHHLHHHPRRTRSDCCLTPPSLS